MLMPENFISNYDDYKDDQKMMNALLDQNDEVAVECNNLKIKL